MEVVIAPYVVVYIRDARMLRKVRKNYRLLARLLKLSNADALKHKAAKKLRNVREWFACLPRTPPSRRALPRHPFYGELSLTDGE